MTWCVYIVEHTPTGWYYVGRTSRPEKRWASHIWHLSRGLHQNINLQQAWLNGRPEEFEFTIIESGLSDADSQEFEEKMIYEGLEVGVVFNIGVGSVGGDTTKFHPNREQVCLNRGNAVRKRMATLNDEDRKASFGRRGKQNGMFGKTHSVSARLAMSEANRGRSRNKGLKRSLEFRKRLSEMAKQRIGPKNPFYGRKHSEEMKRRFSEARKGSKPSNSRPVRVGDTVYESVTEAGRRIGVSAALIIYRIKSSKYMDYSYVSEQL